MTRGRRLGEGGGLGVGRLCVIGLRRRVLITERWLGDTWLRVVL
jgi:hypothetical protein